MFFFFFVLFSVTSSVSGYCSPLPLSILFLIFPVVTFHSARREKTVSNGGSVASSRENKRREAGGGGVDETKSRRGTVLPPFLPPKPLPLSRRRCVDAPCVLCFCNETKLWIKKQPLWFLYVVFCAQGALFMNFLKSFYSFLPRPFLPPFLTSPPCRRRRRGYCLRYRQAPRNAQIAAIKTRGAI